MKFLRVSFFLALVLMTLLLAGCTATPPNGGTQGGSQLLGSALNEADYTVQEPSAASPDTLSDVGDLGDTGFSLIESDLQ